MFNINHLHHAYLIEGQSDVLLPELFSFFEKSKITTKNNPDFSIISIDTFKVDDARDLKSKLEERSFSGGKKIFVISANIFLPEAQNMLLKALEDPKENTHFFICMPDTSRLLKTFTSRCFLIKKDQSQTLLYEGEVKKFLKMSLSGRLEFIKDFIAEKKEHEEGDNLKHEILNFLNTLEQILHKENSIPNIKVSEHIMNIRESLHQPGSSAKMLFESVAVSLS